MGTPESTPSCTLTKHHCPLKQLLPLDAYIAAVRGCRGLSAQGSVVSEEEGVFSVFFVR
jgi:hypothetical protein